MTLGLRAEVLARDKGCLANLLGATDNCRDKWGAVLPLQGRYAHSRLELDHIREQPMMGKRAPSDAEHLLTLCPWHHRDSGWATSHRPELRAYLRGVTA